MSADSYRVVFPPCIVGMEIVHRITLKLEGQAEKGSFFCESREEKYLTIEFMDDAAIILEDDETFTTISVQINVCCNIPYSKVLLLTFCNENGAACEVEVGFCYVQCPLTLHVNNTFDYNDNTYPFYPTKDDKVYGYMERTADFLEKWMYMQGYRRDFFPRIPESFYALSKKPSTGQKSKSSVGNFTNFIRRLAGPLVKYSKKGQVCGADEVFKHVLDVYDSYEGVVKLLKARSCHLWIIQPRFLLSFEQFSIYCNNVTSKTNADILLTRELLDDPHNYYRLSKLAWIEFVLQCYRAFVLNCCFLDCACPKTKERDVVKVLLAWYNKLIAEQHFNLRGRNTPFKTITNITKDMSDGIAIISVLLHYCPFMIKHFKSFAEVDVSHEAEGCQTGHLTPLRRCKLSGQLYRPSKVEIPVLSPFFITANYDVTITDIEPHFPVNYGGNAKPMFFLRRLKLIQNRITLNAAQKGFSEEENVYKLYLQLICLNATPVTNFIWFRSDVGEFYVKVVSQARCDMAVDTLHAYLRTWPLEPCSCGEACTCYRSTEVSVPHKNPLMFRAMRLALVGYASPEMVDIFDRYIDTLVGREIVSMLLEDGGTDMKQVAHILRQETTYKMTSRSLSLQRNLVTLAIHSDALLQLPITLPADDKYVKFSFYMTSDCGLDIRFYRVLLSVESEASTENAVEECCVEELSEPN